jgi:RND family efflux transporter MFP subunit
MRTKTWLVIAAAAAAVIGGFVVTRNAWNWNNAAAQAARPQPRAVPVETAVAEKKSVPVKVDALGNVTPMASVAVKSRLASVITAVHFSDGARVKQGDLLFTLDSSQIEAQIAQAEGVLARDQAQLEGAERDVRRYTELVAKNATPQINLDNAKTQADSFRAAIKADQGALDNLKVQLGWTRIAAPISGRISIANVKVGNYVQPTDATPLATIIQVAPVYVSFTVSQKVLPDIRTALASETATVEAAIPGDTRRASGAVSMIENAVDASTGMVIVRATMPNEDEILWPGTLVNVSMTLRVEEAVVVPSVAVQVSQTGTFVFIVQDGTARAQPVKVERTVDNMSVIGSGLAGGEAVVTDGQLLLSNGTRVAPRENKAGA